MIQSSLNLPKLPSHTLNSRHVEVDATVVLFRDAPIFWEINLDGMADGSWISSIESVPEIKMKYNRQNLCTRTRIWTFFLILVFTICLACTTFLWTEWHNTFFKRADVAGEWLRWMWGMAWLRPSHQNSGFPFSLWLGFWIKSSLVKVCKTVQNLMWISRLLL